MTTQQKANRQTLATEHGAGQTEANTPQGSSSDAQQQTSGETPSWRSSLIEDSSIGKGGSYWSRMIDERRQQSSDPTIRSGKSRLRQPEYLYIKMTAQRQHTSSDVNEETRPDRTATTQECCAQ